MFLYRLVSYRQQQIEENLRTPWSLDCDGVHFGELWGPRGEPSVAHYDPNDPATSQKGEGALFVKLAGGPPIRLRELKPEDVGQGYGLERMVSVEGGVETITFTNLTRSSRFEFQAGALIGASIRAGDLEELVFCDRTGVKEFTLDTRFEKIAELLGPENCELGYPERR